MYIISVDTNTSSFTKINSTCFLSTIYRQPNLQHYSHFTQKIVTFLVQDNNILLVSLHKTVGGMRLTNVYYAQHCLAMMMRSQCWTISSINLHCDLQHATNNNHTLFSPYTITLFVQAKFTLLLFHNYFDDIILSCGVFLLKYYCNSLYEIDSVVGERC